MGISVVDPHVRVIGDGLSLYVEAEEIRWSLVPISVLGFVHVCLCNLLASLLVNTLFQLSPL